MPDKIVLPATTLQQAYPIFELEQIENPEKLFESEPILIAENVFIVEFPISFS
jgi:hypothetical protein